MKPLLAAALLLATPSAFADDAAQAKATFEKFVQLQKANDRKILDLISADSSGRIIESDGEIEVVTEVPKGQLVRSVEAALLSGKGEPEPYEKVEFEASGETVTANGFIRYEKADFNGPFSMEFTEKPAGEVKITAMTITVPLTTTPVKSHDLFAFDMPGSWKPVEGKKLDLGDGKTMYPGGATGRGSSLAFFAFEDSTVKPGDQDLKNFPEIVAQPIVKKLTAQGGKEERSEVLELTPGNKDQAYFVRTLLAPDGKQVVVISGIVLRTKARIYVIQTVGTSPPNVKLWRKAAAGLKEL